MTTSRQVLSDGSILERNETQLRGETPDKIGLKYEEKRTYPENGMPLRLREVFIEEIGNEFTGYSSAYFEMPSAVGKNTISFEANLTPQEDDKNNFKTNGHFNLKLNGKTATFFDLTDEEVLMVSSVVPTKSTDHKIEGRSKFFGDRIMAIDTSKPTPEMIKGLANLYEKGYPEAGLTLAHMYQCQALQANQAGNKDTGILAKRNADKLFTEIIENKSLSKELKETARNIRTADLKGKTVHDMYWARKSADETAKFATVFGIAGTITAGIGLTAVLGASLATAAAISPAIGIAVGGAILIDKYRNSTTSEKSGFKSVLKTEIKDAISLLTGGR